MLGCLLVLTGCSERQSALFLWSDYAYRMGNSLQLDIPVDVDRGGRPADWQSLRYPSRRQLLYAVPTSSINLLEFLRLSRCELQRLIGQRNTSLGQLAPGSQRFLYEWRFLQLARECVRQLQAAPGGDADIALAEELQRVVAEKSNSLPLVYWNAVAASEEFQTLFSLAAQPLGPVQAQVMPTALIDSLQGLLQIQRALIEHPGGELSSLQHLESHFQVLAASHHFGQLTLAMATAVPPLQAITAALQRRLQDPPLCYQQRPTPQARILESVFHKVYIGRVQPYLSALHRQSIALQPLLQQFYTRAQGATVSLPPIHSEWWQATWAPAPANSAWQHFDAALSDHTRAWQQLLSSCGLMPRP